MQTSKRTGRIMSTPPSEAATLTENRFWPHAGGHMGITVSAEEDNNDNQSGTCYTHTHAINTYQRVRLRPGRCPACWPPGSSTGRTGASRPSEYEASCR